MNGKWEFQLSWKCGEWKTWGDIVEKLKPNAVAVFAEPEPGAERIGGFDGLWYAAPSVSLTRDRINEVRFFFRTGWVHLTPTRWAAFWEGHDPTQGMRQAGDVGTQYRSMILASSADDRRIAERSREIYQRAISAAGFGAITTEIVDAGPFYFAEDYHQQYLEANPGGYCGHGGTGVSCPFGLADYEGGAE